MHAECWLNLLAGVVSVTSDNISNKNNVIRKYVNPFKLPGIYYICPACEETTIPKEEATKSTRTNLKDKVLKNASDVPTPLRAQIKGAVAGAYDSSIADESTKEKEPEKITNSKGQVPKEQVPKDTPNTPSCSRNQTEVIDVTSDAEITANDQFQVKSAVITAEAKSDVDTSRKKETPGTQDPPAAEKVTTPKKLTQVCRYFRRGTCKHGLRGVECKYSHPQMCRKFLQHGTRQPTGCNLGQRCKFFHPLMCLDSLRNSECYNENCTYHHVVGTRRQPKLIKNQQQDQITATKSKMSDEQHPEERDLTNEQVEEKRKELQSTNQDDERNNQSDHFLELIRLLKAEIISSMNVQISALAAQIQGIQQVQARQMIPLQMTHYQPGMTQVDNPLLFTPQPRGSNPIPIQLAQRMQTPTANSTQIHQN